MGKKKSSTPDESYLLLPTPPTLHPIIDTHTHLVSTFNFYQTRYKAGKFTDLYEFVRGMYEGRGVKAIVDVWCEAPLQGVWKGIADSALEGAEGRERWGGVEYWFAMGVHPHDASKYTDQVELQILEAMTHPRCVSWGEMGLDYHYDFSPRDIQRDVFRRQLAHAVRLGKPLTIHTREADEDTEAILKEVVPREHKIHIHCFTDTPEFAQNLLDYFPNLYIGITGVITYATNTNTAQVIKNLVSSPSSSHSPSNPPSDSASSPADSTSTRSPLRILLETDAPYMVPANLYDQLPELKGKKLPLCHTAMVPWTAKFVADAANAALRSAEGDALSKEDGEMKDGREVWDAEKVMRVAEENARFVYGV